jgi:hypothetical protein
MRWREPCLDGLVCRRLFLALVVGLIVILMAVQYGDASTRGRAVRALVVLDARTGAIETSFPDINPQRGSIESAVADGHGGWFVAGNGCLCVGDQKRYGIGDLQADGSFASSFKPKGVINVTALLTHASTVYIGVAGGNNGALLALDARTGRRLWTVPVTALHGGGRVTGLTFAHNVLYVTGVFGRIAGDARTHIAALDPATGMPTRWRVELQPPSGQYGDACCIGATTDTVFFAGSFTHVNGAARDGSAAADAKTGKLSPWHLGPGQPFDPRQGFVAASNVLLIDKEYRLWAFTTGSGRPEPWLNGLRLRGRPGYADTATAAASTLYLGGNGDDPDYAFDRAGGLRANNLAAVDLGTGKFTSWRPLLDAREVEVYLLAASGAHILAAGSFQLTR